MASQVHSMTCIQRHCTYNQVPELSALICMACMIIMAPAFAGLAPEQPQSAVSPTAVCLGFR